MGSVFWLLGGLPEVAQEVKGFSIHSLAALSHLVCRQLHVAGLPNVNNY